MVATIEQRPVAVARTVLVTPAEAWTHAVRDDPKFRGRGIAGVLAASLIQCAGCDIEPLNIWEFEL